MKCCDSSTPTKAFSCDLQWYLLPTLRVALISFHGNLEALILCWTWSLLSIFIKPNVEFYHKHGDFKVIKLFSISSQTFANK